MKRREFLKVFGGAVGGAFILSSCGSGGGGDDADAPPIPNGYKFYRLVDTGSTMPDGSVAENFSGSVKISDNHDIIFHAVDAVKADGIYEFTMDFSGDEPVIGGKRKIVKEGDTLKDGTVVGSIDIGSPNKLGYYATLLNTADGITSVYMEREKSGLELVAKSLESLPGGKGKFGASFGDIELDDTNSIILVSHYVPEKSSQPKEGLFYLCGGVISDAGKLLVSSGDLLPESSTAVGRIGLIDIAKSSGEYVAQVNCGIAVLQSAGMPAVSMPVTALVSGNVNGRHGKPRLRGASKPLLSSAALTGPLKGDILYGPRIGAGNKVAQVIHNSADNLSLYLDSSEVAHTGGLSPRGRPIISFSGPAVTDDGLLYCLLYTDEGEELCVYNGSTASTILSTGDKLAEEDTKAIMSIGFGFVRNMVDKDGRVVFVGIFDDDSKSVILGIPV